MANFCNVILSPREDKASKRELSDLKSQMKKYSDSIIKIDLQDFVERGLHCENDDILQIMLKFDNRYMDTLYNAI